MCHIESRTNDGHALHGMLKYTATKLLTPLLFGPIFLAHAVH